MFATHAKSFQSKLDDMFGKRPTGRPNVDVDAFRDTLKDAYKKARNDLDAARKAAKKSKKDADYKSAVKQVAPLDRRLPVFVFIYTLLIYL